MFREYYHFLKFSWLLITGFFFLVPFDGLAQNEIKMDVAVTVKADESFETLLKSRILRELRDFSDIRIVEESKLYNLSVVSFQSGGLYLASVIVTTPVNIDHLMDRIANAQAIDELEEMGFNVFEEDDSEILSEMSTKRTDIVNRIKNQFDDMNFESHSEFPLGNAVYVENLFAISDTDISSLAERIVAEVDVNNFESYRPFLRIQIKSKIILDQQQSRIDSINSIIERSKKGSNDH